MSGVSIGSCRILTFPNASKKLANDIGTVMARSLLAMTIGVER